MGILRRISMACGVVAALGVAGCGPAAFQVQWVPAGQELSETQVRRDPGLIVLDKIALIDVEGMLSARPRRGLLRAEDSTLSQFVEKLDRAAGDSAVKAVVLRIDSPGGTVAATDAMHAALLRFKQKTGKPVIACVLGLGCSGAYYLACGTDGIVAQPGAVVGSIGTILQTFSVKGTMDKLGIEAVAIKSGRLKDMGSPLKHLGGEERQVLQGIIDRFYEQFLAAVEQGRPGLEAERLRTLADGRVFAAEAALHEGLIDRVGYLDDAIAWARDKAGIRAARTVMYHRPSSYVGSMYDAAAAIGGTGLVHIELPDWLQARQAEFLYVWQPGFAGD